ncbi:hypothetical protein Goshw_018960, partial [Gossypium schwendimanii]|nr:hypothetical protein [Gossypium schwendimanii]
MKLYANIYVFIFLLLLSFLRSSEADFGAFNSNLLAVNACAVVNCGQGTCRETRGTLDFGCGAESPSSPPPPLPSWTFNLSDRRLVPLLGVVMGVAKQMGLAMNVIAMKDMLIYLLSQPYLASKN